MYLPANSKCSELLEYAFLMWKISLRVPLPTDLSKILIKYMYMGVNQNRAQNHSNFLSLSDMVQPINWMA